MHVLENPPQHDGVQPRASLVLPSRNGGPEIWMGGAHTPRGEVVDAGHVARSLLIDCAGDLPRDLREAAGRFQPLVFLDIEERPAAWLRIREVAGPGFGGEGFERVTVLCTHGMNRSGLVAGMFLRALGHSPADAVAMIRAARPGALSNETFVALLGEE
jgi:hypothetical protein